MSSIASSNNLEFFLYVLPKRFNMIASAIAFFSMEDFFLYMDNSSTTEITSGTRKRASFNLEASLFLTPMIMLTTTEITAAVAVAIGDELGCVVEKQGINKKPEEVIREAKSMVTYMMEKRDVEIKNLIVEKATTTVKEIASVVASVVYLEE